MTTAKHTVPATLTPYYCLYMWYGEYELRFDGSCADVLITTAAKQLTRDAIDVDAFDGGSLFLESVRVQANLYGSKFNHVAETDDEDEILNLKMLKAIIRKNPAYSFDSNKAIQTQIRAIKKEQQDLTKQAIQAMTHSRDLNKRIDELNAKKRKVC